ncbi:MAG TPA: hypothetical protein VL095_00975 [Flavisolibacter sp.]|nr:hypothetical protein [Flavisolibacter sp.]
MTKAITLINDFIDWEESSWLNMDINFRRKIAVTSKQHTKEIAKAVYFVAKK